MTAQDVITAARVLCKDQWAPYRVADAAFVLWVDEAVRETVRRRPDTLFVSAETLPPHAAISTTGATISLVSDTLAALVDYVASRYFLREGDGNRATYHERRWLYGLGPTAARG